MVLLVILSVEVAILFASSLNFFTHQHHKVMVQLIKHVMKN